MRGLQRLGDLLRDRQGLIQRDRPLRDPVGQSRPLDQLQHQRPRPLSFLDAVDGGDAGVVEAGEDLRFPLEPGEPIGVLGKGVRQNLERHLAVELGVSRLPDLSHTAFAEEGGDRVVAEAGADG